MASRHFANQLTDFIAGTEAASILLNNSRQRFKQKTLETAATCIQKFPANPNNIDGGLYVGICGLAYALWYAASKKTVFDQTERSQLLNEARRLIDYNLNRLQKRGCCCVRFDRDVHGEEAGFLLGASGVYMTAALIYREFNENATAIKYLEKCNKLAAQSTENVHYLRHGSDELFVGRAGYLCGIVNVHQKWKQQEFDTALVQGLVKTIVDSGNQYARKHGTQCNLMYAYHSTEYLGAAHGLTGILQFCLSFPTVDLGQHVMQELKGAVDWLCSVQEESGNFPCATDEMGSAGRADLDELIHWCHGAPGTVYLLARAYQIWHGQRYLQAALQCGEVVWKKGLLKKGPGICHGIAGNAYVFLLLYRLTGYTDERHLHRALQFVDFMDSSVFKNEARTPDTPYSLFEGWAGTLCLYADLAAGKEGRDAWEFPLMPVFF